MSAHHFGEARTRYEDAFVDWATHLNREVGAKTADRYKCSFRQVDTHLKGLFVDQIDIQTIRIIVADRRRAGATNATIRRDLTALSQFLEFCAGEGWREEEAGNPALAQHKRLKERRDPIVLPVVADVERVISRAPGNMGAIIRAAWLTGCRLDELVSADRRRLDRQRRQLTVIGKGNKLRVVSLWRPGAYECISEVVPFLGSPVLFYHSDGVRYANLSGQFRALIDATIKEDKRRAKAAAQDSAQPVGTEFRRFRFHDLRHLYAVEALKMGRSLYDVQGDLGHTSVQTTEMYLDYLTPEEAAAARKASHAATV